MTDSMSRHEYEQMRATENRLWWFRALHAYLLRFLSHDVSSGQTALDVGCGTGGFMQQLAGRGYATTGLDVSLLAATLSRERGLSQVIVGSANELPLASESFDLVVSVDVLEVGPVAPQKLAAEAWRVLKPGGRGLFVMAAHQWLLSEHDRAVGSVRRYNLQQMQVLFTVQGFKVVRATYLFAALFPPMAVWKLLNPPRKDEPLGEAVSDVRLPHPLVNGLLSAISALEIPLHPGLRLPFGTSALVLVEKK
ncbi:MAG: class I SAM-dependent methyltransferase [Anaerolineales bacterium]|nr:class I SAM-dependent methyltransferase [Anaerolineales bacterium]